MGKVQSHFYFLLIGRHPAWSKEAICRNAGCKGKSRDTIYRHHFFDCGNYKNNRTVFRYTVRRLFMESQVKLLPLNVIEEILSEPCCIGLIDLNLFNLGLRIGIIHELHRICTIASVSSWGRFYAVPL